MRDILKEKIRYAIKFIMPAIATFSFIICVGEGYFYYSLEEALYVKILMNINNVFKTFLFSPSISINDAKKLIELRDVNILRTVVSYFYMAVVILAPICTATALLKAIEKTTRGWINKFKKAFHKKIFVFGYNKYSKEFINNISDSNKKVILIEKKTIIHSERLELLRKGVVVIQDNFSDGNDYEIKYKFRKLKMERDYAIVIFEEVVTVSFSILLNIIEFYEDIEVKSKAFKRNYNDDKIKFINCSLSCEDHGMQEVITDYYDRYIDDGGEKGNNRKINIDLKLFSVPEIQARELFRQKPIYQYNLLNKRTYSKRHYEWEESTKDCINPWDTHLVIVGFGDLGQNVLLQALNLGNLQSKSTITIDVFDKTVDEKKGIFAKRFSQESAEISENFIQIPKKKENSDGKIFINFHKLDVRTIDFENNLKKLENVTYIAICFEDSSLSTISMVTIEKYFKNVPIAVQMDMDKKVIDYIKKNNKSYKEVFPFATKGEILDEDKIIKNNVDEQAILYNAKYDEYCNYNNETKKEEITYITRDKKTAWNKMILVKKNSSRKSVEHETTKVILLLVDSWINNKISDDNIMKKVRVLLECLEKHKNYEDENFKQIFSGLINDAYNNINEDKVYEIFRNYKALEELAVLEHKRWCNFMVMNGYRYENSSKNDSKKTNPCILSWELLCKQKPDMLIYDLMGVFICAEQIEGDIFKLLY